MSKQLIPEKPDGGFVVHCQKHNKPYSVWYSKRNISTYFHKDDALRRAEEFRVSHIMFSPDCSLDAKVEEVQL